MSGNSYPESAWKFISTQTFKQSWRASPLSGSNAEILAREAIERFVDYDEWFIAEVEKGLASADRGQLLTHEEVGQRLEAFIFAKRPRA